jgi:CheY-like chemotaxis protein
MYATKFTETGDQVVCVGSGEEALQISASESFDTIIMDMVMPGMTGIDLLKAFKETTLPNKPTFIVLSNQGEESDIEAAHAQGASGYIIKADSIPSEVVEKVHHIVSK